MFQMRAQDFGIRVGSLPKGPRNKITDVPGVLVGHATVDTPTHKTGVTVILPGPQNPFTHKLPAGVCPFNGFGKTAGLLQLQELGHPGNPPSPSPTPSMWAWSTTPWWSTCSPAVRPRGWRSGP